MVRLVVFLVGVAAVATGLSWLADRPGSLVVNWQGYEVETSVFRAVVILALLMGLAILSWSMITALWRSPASVGAFFSRRRQMRGLEALSGGMIAIGAGDKSNAARFAVQARKALPNEPLTHLLRAQAAQLAGDRSTARRMFESMLASPETEQLGLRGLFLEAEREGEVEAARQFAERSVELNPGLPWAVDALFDLQCKAGDWGGAMKTLGIAQKHQHHDKAGLARRRAVVMTARALALEETDPSRAMGLAIEAHHLAHDLIPAAALAGRMLAARGHTKRAAKIVERAWRRAPHPDLAVVYAYARLGDSPHDRLERVKRLSQLNPHSIETPIAIATAAVEAREWELARRSLEPLDANRTTQRVCTLMARIEGEQNADKGRVREWLARAVHAPRDPAWVAGGVVAERWSPIAPDGAFDAFQWRVPADALDGADKAVLAQQLAELVRLGTDLPAAVDAPAVGEKAATVVTISPETEKTKSGAKPSAQAPVGKATATASADAEAIEVAPLQPARETAKQPSREAEDAAVVAAIPMQPRQQLGATARKPAAAATAGGREAVNPPEAADESKPLEPSMFIAPKSTEDAAADKDGNSSERPTKGPRVVASGQR